MPNQPRAVLISCSPHFDANKVSSTLAPFCCYFSLFMLWWEYNYSVLYRTTMMLTNKPTFRRLEKQCYFSYDFRQAKIGMVSCEVLSTITKAANQTLYTILTHHGVLSTETFRIVPHSMVAVREYWPMLTFTALLCSCRSSS